MMKASRRPDAALDQVPDHGRLAGPQEAGENGGRNLGGEHVSDVRLDMPLCMATSGIRDWTSAPPSEVLWPVVPERGRSPDSGSSIQGLLPDTEVPVDVVSRVSPLQLRGQCRPWIR